jgi:GAF domain-containing protein
MVRGAKPAKAKVEARPSVARKSRKVDGSTGRQLEQRLTEALEQQAATSEILRVISRSRTDVQPVFDTIAQSAAQLCEAEFCHVFRFDGELLHFAAHHGLAPEGVEAARRAYPMAPGRGSAASRSVVSRAVEHIPDVHADPDYAHGAFAKIMTFRSIVAVPMLREDLPIGSIAVARSKPGLFPDAQIKLLQTFADQAVIAIENVRLFTELQARNGALGEALEQQTATSDVLRVISESTTDVQPVFDAIARDAVRLCDANYSVIGRYDGQLLHLVAHEHVRTEGVQAMLQLFPMRPSRATTSSRAILDRAVVHVPDVLEDPDYDQPVALGIQNRSTLAVPMMRDGHPIGTISVGRLEPQPFSEKQIALLKTFADQAVIAIENVRLFKELETRNRDLTEALEQQTATSEILRVISQSQMDVQPVFDTIVAAALKLCSARSANVFTFDGELIHLAAFVNVNAEYIEAMRQFYPRPPSRDTGVTRAIQTCSVIAIPDVVADREYAHAIGAHSLAGAFRSVLAVPLVREGSPIGAIAVGRAEPGPFPDTQVELLKTFADQAVIAIENVRLFNELETRNSDLTEALQQQTATSDILRVISQSQTDAQPVFDTIAAAAMKLCRASSGNVVTFDGELIHIAALAIVNPEGADAVRRLYPRPPGRDTAASRAVLTGRVVAIPDVLEEPEYAIGASAVAAGFRSVLAVPLMRERNPIGAILVGRSEPGPFPDKQIALLQTFADQAVIAIENARLFKELEARTTELTRSVGELEALGEVGQAVSSTLDLETVLRTIVSRATTLAGMDGGSIYEYDEIREEFYLHTADRLPDELVDALRATPIRKGEGALGRMAVTGEPVQIRDIGDERAYQSRVRKILIRLGYRSVLAIPLLREKHLLGGLVVNRNSAGEFAPQVIDLLKTFATQSALAIQNARLFREIEEKSRQLETASRHKSEFLANMSHELRTPLNAIIGFSEVLSERMFGEINDKQAEYLTDILESGRHLLSLINDILDLSKIEAGRMELEPTDFDLPAAIENTLILVRERAQRRGITLGRTIDERLGMIRADERKLKQVLLNLLSNALKFTPEGGQIHVRARAHNGEAEISVADTGVGIAPEDQEAVFEEFRQVGTTARKVEGTGLGLAISRKFIELHGGRIRVDSQVGLGSTFAFTLPLTIDQGHPTGS